MIANKHETSKDITVNKSDIYRIKSDIYKTKSIKSYNYPINQLKNLIKFQNNPYS